MRQPPHPALESSAALRELIHSKRLKGKLTEALILARMGAQAAQFKGVGAMPDDVSRLALRRYLELMPQDGDARQQLQLLGPEVLRSAPLPARWRRFWPLTGLALAGLVSAASIHFNGLPQMLAPKPVHAQVVSLPPPTAVAPKAEDSAPIVIHAVGDVVLGSDYPAQHLPSDSDKQRIAALHLELRRADIVLGNLEGVLSDQGTSRKDASKPGFFTFRMPTAYAATLRSMGFDVMSLANNHSMDFGAQGLASTLSALRANGIAPMGVPGAEAARIKVRNTTVAFLNYSYLPAFARLNDSERIRTDIAQARTTADWVVVSVHGGKEGTAAIGTPHGDEYFMHEYRGDLLKFAHLAIDAGASAVFGHGPHVVRPYDLYQGKPIFYSLGNFVGYRSLSTEGKLANSIVAEVRFSPQGQLLGAGIIPLKLDRSGIPAADYSADSLQTLRGLLLDTLEQRPVLELATRQATAPQPEK